MLRTKVMIFHIAVVLIIGLLSSWLVQYAGGMWTVLFVILSAVVSAGLLFLIARIKEAENIETAEPQQMTVDMYDIAENLSFISQQLVWVVGQSGTALKRLTSQSGDIARESEIAASSAEETSAGVQEIAASSAVVANSSREALNNCHNSSERVMQNQQEVMAASNKMLEVAQAVQASVQAMEELSAASQKIGEFVGKIRGIASQTNLLALNAAIEAARAGEAGRGFAVVAEEVRKLATESEVLTHEAEASVKDIAARTKHAAESMQTGQAKIAGIEQSARNAAHGMNEVVAAVKNIEETVVNLSQLSLEQQTTTEQMAIAVESIGNTTVEIAGSTQDALQNIARQEKSIAEMYEFAQHMTTAVDKIQEVAVHFKKANELIFGFNPFTMPRDIKENYMPVLEEVAYKLGCQARVIIVSDYDSLGRSLLQGTIDVGWFSPFAYVSAKEKGGILPLVTTVVNQHASYEGYIISRKDKGYSSLDDLRGARFAFVDKQSASGYVYPKVMLLQQGKDPDKFLAESIFLGNHNRVIESVLAGDVDAGGTYSEALAAAKGRGLAVDNLTILAKTEPIPKDVIAARPNMDAAQLDKLKAVLLATTQGTCQQAGLMKKIGLNGFIAAQDNDYDVIRQAAKVLKN